MYRRHHSLDVRLLEELHIRERSHHVLINHLPQFVVLEIPVPWAL